MAHEITSHDNVILHREAAWHGLGLIVDDAPTPREAAKIVFPWTVCQKPMFIKNTEGRQQIIEGFKANLRSDTNDQLGIVSENYGVVQPEEVADFCEALLEVGQVKCETAGSIRSGRRIWFLLKGEPFEVAMGDKIFPYLCVSHGYDGVTAFRVTPTTVRGVCSNTLHQIIPRYDTGELLSSAISIRHTSNIMDRLEEAKKALKNYNQALESTKSVITTLTNKEVTSDEVKKFFLECYTEAFGDIPDNPQDGFEARRQKKAMSAFNSFSRRFDDERAIAGTTAWNMANAWSGLVQNDMKARGGDDVDRIERRVESNLFGLGQDRTQKAFQRAFRMAVTAG